MPERRIINSLHVAIAASLLAFSAFGCNSNKDQGTTKVAKAASDTLSDSVLTEKLEAGRYEGNPQAPIWVVMVSDFQCPYCKVWHDSTLADVRRDYVSTGRARLAYLNLPLQMHQHASVMATAAMCAGAQNKFWPFADSLFAKQSTIAKSPSAEPAIQTTARDVNLDSAAFAHCRSSHVVSSVIGGDVRQAEQAKIQATPSFFVGQFVLEGAVPYNIFKRAIDSALVIAAQKR
ncbi:MAG: thioredoxin domain-containing protein [Gemmatimonadaceae bacterium]